MCCIISIIILITGILVLTGIVESDNSYWTGIVSMVIGVWIPSPKLPLDQIVNTEDANEKTALV